MRPKTPPTPTPSPPTPTATPAPTTTTTPETQNEYIYISVSSARRGRPRLGRSLLGDAPEEAGQANRAETIGLDRPEIEVWGARVWVWDL